MRDEWGVDFLVFLGMFTEIRCLSVDWSIRWLEYYWQLPQALYYVFGKKLIISETSLENV